MNFACVIIDMQRFFFEENPSLLKTKLLTNCITLLEAMRRAKAPIIHVHTLYEPDRLDWPRAWKNEPSPVWCEGLIEGALSAQVLPGLEPKDAEPIVRKRRFSGFYETTLRTALQRFSAQTVILAGYSADVCIRFTAADAYNHGYDVVIVRNCVEAFKEKTVDSIEYLHWLTNCDVVSVDWIQQYLTSCIGGASSLSSQRIRGQLS
jgi:nicotinamidase-related amidase